MGQKLTDRTALTSIATGDLLHVVDISDNTDSAEGTSKKITQDNLIPDSSDTVKGKVELATSAETITGTDTVRAVTPSNITAKIDTDGTLTGNLDTRIPSQKAVKTYADTKTTLATVLSTIASGWTSYTAVTPTYTSADDPTYTITFASVDLTSTMSAGMKVKFTNNATTFYGFITAIAFSTNTVVTLYGGTDYDVANSAISEFSYSTMKAPLGFPLDPEKWTVITTDSGDNVQNSPTATTWYNLGSVSIVIPIGVWRTILKVVGYTAKTATSADNFVTLSTENNSESNTKMTGYCVHGGASGALSPSQTYQIEDMLVLAAKTTYYLNTKTNTATASSIYNLGGLGTPTIIRAVCSYL